MDKRTHKAVVAWKKVLDSLYDLEAAWGEWSAVMGRREPLLEVPTRAAKVLRTQMWRTKFVVGLPRLMSYAQTIGGIKNLAFEVPKSKPAPKGAKEAEE